MFRRDRIRGLMAQAVYEELEPAEKEVLDSALERSENFRSEAKALDLLVKRIPQEAVEFSGDLVPAIRAGIREESATFSLRKAHRVAAFAALALVVSGVGYMIAMRPPVALAPTVAEAPAASDESRSPLDAVIAQAESLMLVREYPKAYVTLSEALKTNAEDSRAGEVRQVMADLAYFELQWYPKAYADYEAMRVRYNAVFQAKPDNISLLNLLEEARGPDDSYPSLLALDAARSRESLSELEKVLENYPATYVASLAADEMALLIANSDGTRQRGIEWQVAAMESALARTTNPVARAQLKIEIGHLVSREMDDAVRARVLYEEVAESGFTVLAELAQDSLERLDAQGQ